MKRPAKRLLLRGLLRLARKPRPGEIVALTYHSIDESGSRISLPPAHFRRQIEWLASSGYRSLAADEAAARLAGRREPTVGGIVLTFDDGFLSVYETAFPILSEFGFVATVFCAAGYVGKVCAWERAPGIPEMPMMSWDELASLTQGGWELGGHTVSHARLPPLSPEAMREEIAEGRRILEDETGCPVTSFAYPYGESDQACAVAVAEAGFHSAWTMNPAANRPGCDAFSLGRFNCDRIRSETPDLAELAVRTYLSGRYNVYAFLTGRRLRVRRRRAGEG